MTAKKGKKADEGRRGPRTRVDWDALHALWRTNTLSNQQLARQFNCSEAMIRKKAKADGWERDLADKVRKRVKEELVRADAEMVRSSHPRAENSNHLVPTDDEIVAAAAQGPVEVVRQHRSDIRGARDLALDLFAELRQSTAHRAEIAEEIDAFTEGDESGKRRDIMHRAVSLNARTSALKDMSMAMKNFQTLERAAWSLDAGDRREDDDLAGLSDEALAAKEAAITAELNRERGNGGDSG